jgi:hypothetical protein
MIFINTHLNGLKLIYFFLYYPLTDQDYKIMGRMNTSKEFTGYLCRRIKKYASKIPALQVYLKDLISSRKVYKAIGDDSSDKKHTKKLMYEKLEMLLDALISDGENKMKGDSHVY